MPSLRGVSNRFASLYMTEGGFAIRGTIFPVEEGKIPSYDFTPSRLLFRTSPDSLAAAGQILIDEYGRRFLLADLGKVDFMGDPTYRTFRLYEMTHQMVWTRESTIIDPVTKLERSTGRQDLGTIWVALELYGREEVDRTLRILEETSRVITGSALQLNDQLDGRVVRRVNPLLGVTVAEIQ